MVFRVLFLRWINVILCTDLVNNDMHIWYIYIYIYILPPPLLQVFSRYSSIAERCVRVIIIFSRGFARTTDFFRRTVSSRSAIVVDDVGKSWLFRPDWTAIARSMPAKRSTWRCWKTCSGARAPRSTDRPIDRPNSGTI